MDNMDDTNDMEYDELPDEMLDEIEESMIRRAILMFWIRVVAIVLSVALVLGAVGFFTYFKWKEKNQYRVNAYENIPIFASSLNECTDTFSEYVLPDGYVYAYLPNLENAFVNRLHKSIDTNGKIYNAVGYLDGARIRSMGEEAQSERSFVTGFIPVRPGDVIRLSGCGYYPEDTEAGAFNYAFYTKDFEQVFLQSMASSSAFWLRERNLDGYVTELEVLSDLSTAGIDARSVAYVRFTLIGTGAESVLTINEEIETVRESGFSWQKTEPYLSEEWMAEIRDTADKIDKTEVSEDTIRFLLTTDIHYEPNGDNYEYVKNIGKVSAGLMRQYDISYFLTTGDVSTQSPWHEVTVFESNMQQVLDVLSPIPDANILLTVGNHDGATGRVEKDGTVINYRKQLTTEQRAEIFFSWQESSDPHKQFSPDGTYYYLDDVRTKTRIIMLNSFWTEWAGEPDGFTTDIQHSFFNHPLLGEEQMNWLIKEALDMPKGYEAILATHNAYSPMDARMLVEVINAYQNRERYKGTFEGDQDWQSYELSANFSSAKGEIIAIFQGHYHKDLVDMETFGIPCITMTTTGQYADVRDENAVERVSGTVTEMAIDLVTIDKENKVIYLHRLGVGEDRIVRYN